MGRQPRRAVDELDGDAWTLVPEEERALIGKLDRLHRRLDEVAALCVGVQTSADAIYHLIEVAPGRYRNSGQHDDGEEIEIEPDLMRPLVSGPQARRYETPRTQVRILFPYNITDRGAGLVSASEMEARFPLGWSYLERHEEELRGREKGRFDDAAWYRFGRSQNIDKQHLPKLGVARLLVRLAAWPDPGGAFCLDNVDVGGVLPSDPQDFWYLTGVLNGRVADFVWQRRSKPFQNGFKAANKQFIAPLPVPDPSPEDHEAVSRLARELHEAHDRRRDLLQRIGARLASGHLEDDDTYDEDWLLPDVGSEAAWLRDAPGGGSASAGRSWARRERKESLEAAHAELDARLYPAVLLEVQVVAGDVLLLADGAPLIGPLPVREQDLDLVVAQWRHALDTTRITRSFGGKRLVQALLPVRRPRQAFVGVQLVEAQRACQREETRIAELEEEINAILYRLYPCVSTWVRHWPPWKLLSRAVVESHDDQAEVQARAAA